MSRLTRDGTAEPVSRDQIPRHARGQGNIIFPVQVTTSRIGNLTRFIHTLLYVMTTYIYIHIYIIYIYIYMCDLYTGCVVFSGLWPTPHTLVDTYQSGALLLVRVESPISQHTAVLLGGGESRCPRWFCS